MGKEVISSMIKVVIVNGRPGAGKTTFEDICQALMGPFCRSRSTVDRIKEVAKRAGWDGRKTLESRKFLSDLKALCREFNDLPFQDIKRTLRLFKSDLVNYHVDGHDAILLVDSREPAEIQRFKDEMDAITVLIRRAAIEEETTSNESDENVFNFDYDYTIDNNGSIDDLRVVAEEFLDLIFSKNDDIIDTENKEGSAE